MTPLRQDDNVGGWTRRLLGFDFHSRYSGRKIFALRSGAVAYEPVAYMLFGRDGFVDRCWRGLANLADSLVDDSVQELGVVQLGLALDVFAGLSSGRFAGGENEVALLGGEGG